MYYGHEAGFLRIAELRREAALDRRAREAVTGRREEQAEAERRRAVARWTRAA